MNKSILYGISVLLLSFALATPVYSKGFIVRSSEGSELIGVDIKDVIFSADGWPFFYDGSDENLKIHWGFIVHLNEGSEIIGVVNTHNIVISPEDGMPHFKKIAADNWEITSESRNQSNIEGMIQNRKDAQHRAEQQRKEQEEEREAKEEEAKKQAELKCYTQESPSIVSGGHVSPGGSLSGAVVIPGPKYRICKDKYGNIVSKDRI